MDRLSAGTAGLVDAVARLAGGGTPARIRDIANSRINQLAGSWVLPACGESTHVFKRLSSTS